MDTEEKRRIKKLRFLKADGKPPLDESATMDFVTHPGHTPRSIRRFKSPCAPVGTSAGSGK